MTWNSVFRSLPEPTFEALLLLDLRWPDSSTPGSTPAKAVSARICSLRLCIPGVWKPGCPFTDGAFPYGRKPGSAAGCSAVSAVCRSSPLEKQQLIPWRLVRLKVIVVLFTEVLVALCKCL